MEMLIKSVMLGFGTVKREMKIEHKMGLALLTENREAAATNQYYVML